MTNEKTIERNKENVVLSVKNLTINFKTDRGIVHAVRGVSFDLYKGETLCIVGESGSGKSVTNKAIMGISSANAIISSGSIMYEGEDLVRVSEEEFHRIRGHKIGMIFQDPLSALNPVMKVGKQIIEATMINKNILKKHYRDLISKELVKFRNCETNYEFDTDAVSKEIENINSINKEFKKLESKKDSDEKTELLNKLNSSALKYIDDTRVLSYSEVERLSERKAHYERKIANAKDNNESELKIKIATFELEGTTKFFDAYSEFSKKIENIAHDDIVSFLNERLSFLKKYKVLIKENYKNLHPLFKEDLNVRKKEAKVINNEYAESLKNEHEAKLDELNKKLSLLKEEAQAHLNSLSEEDRNRILEVESYNNKLKKKIAKDSKRNREINVSKISKNDEVTFKETNNSKYDEITKQIEEVKSLIEQENRDYINKTKITKAEAKKMALEVMREVGIPLPEVRFKQYPFEFSGGMRQRIVIAIALTANPDILICDEPTTALDVTIQAQILELINKLKRERNLSCIFITHDLGVVANMADRVAVMYAGKIVEYGLANEVFFNPKHPYTWALLSSIPDVDSKEKLEAIPGTPPDMLNPPEGDAFALRSKYAMAIDFKYEPPFFKISDTHYAATWLLYPGAPEVEMPAIVKTRIENSLREEQERLAKEKKEEI